jgi:hypothetical protein
VSTSITNARTALWDAVTPLFIEGRHPEIFIQGSSFMMDEECGRGVFLPGRRKNTVSTGRAYLEAVKGAEIQP